MRRFPVLSTDAELNDRIARICARMQNVFEPVFFASVEDALEFIRFELPEFQMLHFSDEQTDPYEFVRQVAGDPWLHYGGIIGVYSNRDFDRVNKLPRETNVVALVPRGQFVQTFFRVLRILVQNRQILFQRDIQSDFLGSVHGSFEMDNDPYNARTYANLIANYLFNSSYIDLEVRDRLHSALFEMLMNAIEHGNCDISYAEKSEVLETTGDIIPLIREKMRDPEIRRKRVYFSYRITPERSYFTIRDEGKGFDWRSRVESSDVNLDTHGHGIRMTRHYIRNLSYNDPGNEVSFELEHTKRASIRPGLFADQEELSFSDDDVVFREGEESNDLFYIVSGRLDIRAEDQTVATLTPDDMFLGEMSFLLGNRRSATVVAKGEVRLLRITKNAFVDGIQRHPHYGIFLARLLAQRLSRLNQRVAAGNAV